MVTSLQPQHSPDESPPRHARAFGDWLPRLPPELALGDVEPIQLRWGRAVYAARSSSGRVSVKLFRGEQIAVPARTVGLMPLIAPLNPPEIVLAQTEPAEYGRGTLTLLVSEWVEGTALDFTAPASAAPLAGALAAVHAIEPGDVAPIAPGVGRMAGEQANAGQLYRRQLERAERAVAAALPDAERTRLRDAMRRLEEALMRLYRNAEGWGLIHGSLRPDHVLVKGPGALRFIDFDVTRFAPCELELAGVLVRMMKREELLRRIAGGGGEPNASGTPASGSSTSFEEHYFARRGPRTLERWERLRGDALRLASFMNLGRRSRFLDAFRSRGPEHEERIDRQMRTEWEDWFEASGF